MKAVRIMLIAVGRIVMASHGDGSYRHGDGPASHADGCMSHDDGCMSW